MKRRKMDPAASDCALSCFVGVWDCVGATVPGRLPLMEHMHLFRSPTPLCLNASPIFFCVTNLLLCRSILAASNGGNNSFSATKRSRLHTCC